MTVGERISRLRSDLTAGLTTALVTIPDGLASAALAGLNPVYGLYALMVGTPVAASPSRCSARRRSPSAC